MKKDDNLNGVKIKFNTNCVVHMIPDDQYADVMKEMKEMKYSKFSDYQQKLIGGTPFEHKSFLAGEVDVIPRWYYEAHKKDIVPVPLHQPTFTDRQGELIPFEMRDAVQHNLIKPGSKMTNPKLVFEIVE